MNFIEPEEYYLHPKEVIKYLKHEFILSYSFETAFLDRLLYDGYLTMAEKLDDLDLLLIKMHERRAIIKLAEFIPKNKNIRHPEKYFLTINTDFDTVVDGIRNQHENCWLTDKLSSNLSKLDGTTQYESKCISIELRTTDGEICAGDIGIISGSRYLSLTGFYTKSGSGSVLLAAIAMLLKKSNFDIWDLGMPIEYKENLGACLIERTEFLSVIEQTKNIKRLFVEYSSVQELLTDQ